MAESLRTRDYFLNPSTGAMKDNTVKGITEQVLRDFLFSSMGVLPTTTITGTSHAVTADNCVLVAPAASNCAISIPAISTAGFATKILHIKKPSQPIYSVTITGVETIDGAASLVLYGLNDDVFLFNNGTAWFTADKSAAVAGRQPYHGAEDRTTTLPTTITTPVFTIPGSTSPFYYWKYGLRFAITTDQSATLEANGVAQTSGSLVSGQWYKITTYVAGDDFTNVGGTNATGNVFKATGTTPTTWTNASTLKQIKGMFVVYYDNPSNLLTASDIAGGPINVAGVLVAVVNWNGIDLGLVTEERHSYQRSIPWHAWAHNTIGCRYRSGLTMTVAPNATPALSTFAITAGEIADEDIQFSISAQTTARIFYQDSATTYKFDNALSTIPGRLGANGRPMYVNNSYVLTQVASATNRYLNMFVYATNDLLGPIYIFVESINAASTTGYTSLTNARAVPFPNLANFKIGQELKPIYRIIWRADGVLQAIDTTQDDYRTVSSVPIAVGTASTTANIVSVTPAGDITATNVQAALEQIDDRDGWENYSDTATASTPISFTGTPVKLTNNGAGAQTELSYRPSTISALWNTSTNRFDFSSLGLGDELSIRVNIEVTTSAVNQEFSIYMNLAIGGSFPYSLYDGDFFYKTAGTKYIGLVIPLYMGSADTLNNPAEIMFTSDANATIKVIGFYISIRNK